MGPPSRGALGSEIRRRGGRGGDKEPLPVESTQVPLQSSYLLPSWADFFVGSTGPRGSPWEGDIGLIQELEVDRSNTPLAKGLANLEV